MLSSIFNRKVMNISNKEYWERQWYEYEDVLPILELQAKRRKEIMHSIDTHHLCARESGWLDHSRNRKETKRYIHMSHHDIYGTSLPHEQPLANLAFNEPVFTKDMRRVVGQVKDAFRELHIRGRVYNPDCWQYKNWVIQPYAPHP